MSSASVFTMQLMQGLAPCFSSMFAELYSFQRDIQILGTFIIVFTILYMLFVGFKPYSISLIKKEKSLEASTKSSQKGSFTKNTEPGSATARAENLGKYGMNEGLLQL